MPEHPRMLGRQTYRDLYDSRICLYESLPLLCGEDGAPTELDLNEPERVADSVSIMNLKHAVITAVARDDLKDGGAGVFAETVRAVRRKSPFTTIEVLPSDMGGDYNNLKTLMDTRPDILNHNIETVRRLTPRVRARATYERSLEFLRRAKEMRPDIPTKSSIMIGLGETKEEIIETMDDLLANNVDIMAIGQYLRPSKNTLKYRNITILTSLPN